MKTSLPESISLTDKLRRFAQGDREMAQAALEEVLPELRRVASREVRGKFSWVELSATELIHETWLRKLRKGGWQINCREHFYCIAALAMREVMIDIARCHLTQKRGKGHILRSLSDEAAEPISVSGDIETIAEVGILMDKLQKRDPQTATIIDMHYFTGFSHEETADILGITPRQVRHHWDRGQKWLKLKLRPRRK